MLECTACIAKVTDIREQWHGRSKLVGVELQDLCVRLTSERKVEEASGHRQEPQTPHGTIELGQPLDDPICARACCSQAQWSFPQPLHHVLECVSVIDILCKLISVVGRDVFHAVRARRRHCEWPPVLATSASNGCADHPANALGTTESLQHGRRFVSEYDCTQSQLLCARPCT